MSCRRLCKRELASAGDVEMVGAVLPPTGRVGPWPVMATRGGRGCWVTEAAICENVGQDCGNGTITLDSTEKTIEGKKKQLIGIWTKKTGFYLEKVEQIIDQHSQQFTIYAGNIFAVPIIGLNFEIGHKRVS
ncbi:hypothetical protein AVEN_59468-1 [Araneus ventricosus]|uniref:Uncharacterized protein n=1 Tax=Araneus ventricosus TaxID=182803 RepID=A0A4Y2JIU8_ARAVE|nr:hypothetical protein AVEN_59468-1 [Araneus ventricosus]